MRRVLFATALGVLTGCTGSLYSTSSWQSGPQTATREAPAVPPVNKAEVLERLGPPSEIRPLEGGDLFLYRMQHTRRDVLDINTRLLGVAGVSLFARIDGEVVDQVLYVRFDRAGRVLDFTTTR